MARKYAIVHQTAAGTDLLQIMAVGVTTTRGWIYEFCVGSDATPADAALEIVLSRGTVSGTGTSITPRALDPGNPAALLGGEGGTFTSPTRTANSAMYMVGLNQRATFRHVVSPGCEYVVPATSDNWVGLDCISSSTGTPNLNTTLQWEE